MRTATAEKRCSQSVGERAARPHHGLIERAPGGCHDLTGGQNVQHAAARGCSEVGLLHKMPVT